jgi:hypothetical protein
MLQLNTIPLKLIVTVYHLLRGWLLGDKLNSACRPEGSLFTRSSNRLAGTDVSVAYRGYPSACCQSAI